MATTCTTAIATEICDLVTNGRTIASACKEKGITYSAFNYASHKDVAIADMFARAREARHVLMADETIDIADRDDLEPHDKQVRITARARLLEAYHAPFSKKVTVDMNVRGNPREAEQKADLRLARYHAQGQLSQVIDIVAEQLPRLADKQSASAVDNAGADSIFD